MTNLGTKNPLLLRNRVQNLHGKDGRAILIIDDICQNLVLLVFGLVLGYQSVEVLFQHYFLYFAEFFEKLLHVGLVEAETVGD